METSLLEDILRGGGGPSVLLCRCVGQRWSGAPGWKSLMASPVIRALP